MKIVKIPIPNFRQDKHYWTGLRANGTHWMWNNQASATYHLYSVASGTLVPDNDDCAFVRRSWDDSLRWHSYSCTGPSEGYICQRGQTFL